jgi:hypothetical protein
MLESDALEHSHRDDEAQAEAKSLRIQLDYARAELIDVRRSSDGFLRDGKAPVREPD